MIVTIAVVIGCIWWLVKGRYNMKKTMIRCVKCSDHTIHTIPTYVVTKNLQDTLSFTLNN